MLESIGVQAMYQNVRNRAEQGTGEYIAAGFTGHGMPMTFFAGQNVADMIAGKEPEPFVAEAFLPNRFAK